jgi:hypothetical protein
MPDFRGDFTSVEDVDDTSNGKGASTSIVADTSNGKGASTSNGKGASTSIVADTPNEKGAKYLHRNVEYTSCGQVTSRSIEDRSTQSNRRLSPFWLAQLTIPAHCPV